MDQIKTQTFRRKKGTLYAFCLVLYKGFYLEPCFR